MVHSQLDRDTLGLQPLGHHGSKLYLEGADLPLHAIVLSKGLVALLTSHAMLRVEPLHGLEQLIPLLG